MSEVKPAPAPAPAAPVKKEKKDKKASKKSAAPEAQYPLEVKTKMTTVIESPPFDTLTYVYIDDACSRVSSIPYRYV